MRIDVPRRAWQRYTKTSAQLSGILKHKRDWALELCFTVVLHADDKCATLLCIFGSDMTIYMIICAAALSHIGHSHRNVRNMRLFTIQSY